LYEIATLPSVARNDNLVVRDTRACSEQSEGIFFVMTNVTFFMAMVLGLDKKRAARRNSPPSQTAFRT